MKQEQPDPFRQSRHENWNTPSEIIENIVMEAVGSPIDKNKRVVNGETNEVYDIKTESGREIIIRINHEKSERFEKERWAINQCAKVGVPVPEVILVKSLEVGGKPVEVCVESKLLGVGLDKVPPEELPSILRELGAVLDKIHSVATNGFGKLDKNGNGKFPSFSELIKGDLYISRDTILPAFDDRPEDRAVLVRAYEVLYKEAETYSSGESRLIHNDLAPDHVLVHNGKISGIIDFESANGADPTLELALWDFKHGEKYPLSFLQEGYLNKDLFADGFERRLNVCKIYRAMTSLRYCLKVNNPSRADRALEVIKTSLKFF